jgi:AcrR family transcriptional regulator
MEHRQRILVKAKELFMRFGIRSVSMDDIASHLGMSKKTIYQFYSDKDELVDAVMGDELELMQEECTKCAITARDAVDEIFLTMEMVLEQFRNMNPMVLFDMEKFHYKTYQRVDKHKREFIGKIIAENIERGIREGVYREDLNVDIMTRFRLESMMLPFNIEVFSPRKYSLVDVSQAMIEHFVYGLASVKGHKLIEKYKSDLQKKLMVHGHAK